MTKVKRKAFGMQAAKGPKVGGSVTADARKLAGCH